jgi:Zn-dependent peptidase ImmA (M78 family)
MTPEVEAVLKTLPRKIKVGAYDWRIKVDTNPSEDYGEANYDNAVITIWPANHQSPERLVGTVIHELLHILYDENALDEVTPYKEETTVVAFETGLVSLLRDNPKLLNWIKRGLKR